MLRHLVELCTRGEVPQSRLQSREEAEEQLRELRKQVAPLADMLEAATKLAQASETGVSCVLFQVS